MSGIIGGQYTVKPLVFSVDKKVIIVKVFSVKSKQTDELRIKIGKTLRYMWSNGLFASVKVYSNGKYRIVEEHAAAVNDKARPNDVKLPQDAWTPSSGKPYPGGVKTNRNAVKSSTRTTRQSDYVGNSRNISKKSRMDEVNSNKKFDSSNLILP